MECPRRLVGCARPPAVGNAGEEKNGVDDGARTRDPRDHNPMLCQLSYIHHQLLTRAAVRHMARLAGLEPTTYGLEIRCSIQLSYRRKTEVPPQTRSRARADGNDPPRPAGNVPGRAYCVHENDPGAGQPSAAGGMLVGARGFEPPTPWSQTRCATGLRHAPTNLGGESAAENRRHVGGASNACEIVRWVTTSGATVSCCRAPGKRFQSAHSMLPARLANAYAGEANRPSAPAFTGPPFP